MAGLETAAGIVGISVAAWEVACALKKDIERIVNAPKVIKSLRDDLAALTDSLNSLKKITEVQWQQLETGLSDRSKTALQRCSSVCDAMRRDLMAWTKRSTDDQLSWRDRTGIGLFKERQVKALAEELQSCKSTFTNVIAVMTFYGTLQSNATLDKIRQELALQRPALEIAAEEGAARIVLVEESRTELSTTDVDQLSEQDAEDFEAASIAVKEEVSSLRGHQDIMQALLDLMQAERVERLAQPPQAQGGTVTNYFGLNRGGVQNGTMTGGTISIGQVP